MELIFVFLLILVVVMTISYKKEPFNMGAINQLMAKGPQDTYLTGDAWKYIPWWYYNYPYSYGPWNIPTRFTKRGGYFGSYYGPTPYNYFSYV